MFYVYVLDNNKEELYVGYTNNLKRRLAEHNQKRTHSTKSGAPWRCIYYEACLVEADARRREGYLKTSGGRRMLKLRLKEHFYKRRARQNITTGYAL